MNVVCFGKFRVRAKIARFDPSVAKELVRESEGEGVGDVSKGVVLKRGVIGRRS